VPRRPGHWLAALRALLVVVAVVDVSVTDFPSSYRPWAWAVTGFFAASAALSAFFAWKELDRPARVRARVVAIVWRADRLLTPAQEAFVDVATAAYPPRRLRRVAG